MIEEGALSIFTDGSCLPGPRRGGVGILFVTIGPDGNEVVREFPEFGYKEATNNQMELYACVIALKKAMKVFNLKEFRKIVVYSDSRYVVDNVKNAIYVWRPKWISRDGRPVANPKIWNELVGVIFRIGIRVDFEWVQGHGKNLHNRRVDKMAKISAKNTFHPPLTQVSVRRKITKEKTEAGSVEMLGQKLTIRPITVEYMNAAKLYRCKFEVMSKKSKYFGKVDTIFSEVLLKDGHCYFVRLNSDMKNPRVKKVFKEVECKSANLSNPERA